MPNIRLRGRWRRARVEEILADHLVRERLTGLAGLDRDIEARRRPRLEVLEDRDRLAEDDRRRFQLLGRRVRDRSLHPSVLEPDLGLDQRYGDRGLGADRPQRPEADAQVADARRVPLQDVERAPRPVPTEDIVHRSRQERASRDADLIDGSRWREDTDIDLGRAIRRTRCTAHDGDLVDDDLAAAQRRSEPVGARGEHDHEDRHRHPRPFPPVEPLEDEIVDRTDQQDVGTEQGEHPAERRQRKRRELRHGADEHVVVDEREAAGGPCGQDSAPQALCRIGPGDPVDRGVKADQGDRARSVGAFGSDHLAADRCEGSTLDERSREGRQRGGGRRELTKQTGEAHGRRVGRHDRTIREERVRERGERLRTDRAAGDDQPPAAGDPAAQRVALPHRQPFRVDILPDDPVECAPGFDTLGEIFRGDAHDQWRHLVLIGQEAQTADDPIGVLRDDRDDELVGIVDRVRRLRGDDRPVAVDQNDGQLAPERRGLCVEEIDLVRQRRKVDQRPEPGLSLRPTREPKFAGDGGTVVLEVDGDRHPGTDPSMPAKQDVRFHRRRIGSSGRTGQWPQRGQGQSERGHDPRGAPSARAEIWQAHVTGHGHSTKARGECGRSKDAQHRPKVARSEAPDRPLSYDGPVPRAAGGAGFARFHARHPAVPRPPL